MTIKPIILRRRVDQKVKCHVCGSEHEAGKFCTKCGNPLQREEVAATHPANSHQQSPSEQSHNQHPYHLNQQNVQQPYGETYYQYQDHPNGYYVKERKKIQYFSFFANSLKNPVEYASKVNGNYWINGLITLILSIMIFSLSIANYFSRIMEISGLRFFGADKVLGLSFWNVFFKGLLYLGIFSVLVLIVIFSIVKLINHADIRFQDVLVRAGSYATIPTLLFIIFFFVTFLDSPNIIFFITTMIQGIFILSISLTILSFKTNSKIDIFYSMFIAIAIFAIIQIIGFNTILEGIINRLINGYDFFNF